MLTHRVVERTACQLSKINPLDKYEDMNLLDQKISVHSRRATVNMLKECATNTVSSMLPLSNAHNLRPSVTKRVLTYKRSHISSSILLCASRPICTIPRRTNDVGYARTSTLVVPVFTSASNHVFALTFLVYDLVWWRMIVFRCIMPRASMWCPSEWTNQRTNVSNLRERGENTGTQSHVCICNMCSLSRMCNISTMLRYTYTGAVHFLGGTQAVLLALQDPADKDRAYRAS